MGKFDAIKGKFDDIGGQVRWHYGNFRGHQWENSMPLLGKFDDNNWNFRWQ